MLTASLFDLTRTNVLTPDPVEPEEFDTQTGEVRSRSNVTRAVANARIGCTTYLPPR